MRDFDRKKHPPGRKAQPGAPVVISHRNSSWERKPSFQFSRTTRRLRRQVPIDGENCAEYCDGKSRTNSNAGLAKKGASLPMRFGKLCVLLVLSLAFGLACSEIPESLNLCDDTSNDFFASDSAPKIGRVQTARREANPRQDAAPTATVPSLPPVHCARPALPSGPTLLRLLSIQRK